MTSATTAPARRPNPWWVGFVSGMATFVDAAATTGVGIALVLFQAMDESSAGLTGNEIGMLTAILTMGVAIGSLLGGRLGDQFGRRKVFIVTLAIIVVGSIAPFIALDFLTMAIGIGLIGLGVGADLPVAMATISEWAEDHHRGKILVFSNILGGFGIATAVGCSIAFGSLGATGGKIIFGAFGVVGFITLLLRLTIPESPSWLAARAEREAGIRTVRADKTSLKDLVKAPYTRPFVTLVVYYALAAMAVGIASSFGTYVAVNNAGMTVADYSTYSLVCLPLAVLAQVGFMSIVDTKWRMPGFVVGAVLVVVSNLIPAAFGFTPVTVLGSVILATVAGAFCFETIMKVWTQESFPTMLRSTAQGTIYAVSRFAVAGMAVVTPTLLVYNPRGLYLGVAIFSAIGFGIGWWGFRNQTRNEFDVEAKLESEVEAGEVAATTVA